MNSTQQVQQVGEKVGENITSSWRDFWNFEIMAGEGGDHLTLGILIIAIVCFVIGIIVSKWLSRRITKRVFIRFKMEASALHLWSSVTFYVSCFFVTLVALKIAHVPLTIFTLMGGAAALGIGFGSKNLVNNFMSGLIFMFEAPARVGDFVEVAGYFGKVTDVGLRATHVEIGLSRTVIIPNSSFLESPLVNWGKSGSPVYLGVSVSVDYRANLQELTKLILEQIGEVPQVVPNLPKQVTVKNFADNGINLEVQIPVRMFKSGDRDSITSSLRVKIDAIFRKENILIPYPQLVIHQAAQLPEEKIPS